MPFTAAELLELPDTISAPRFATYLQATGNDRARALALYEWNLDLSAAFIVPLQVCEVAVRNGVAEAIEKVHGATGKNYTGLSPNPAAKLAMNSCPPICSATRSKKRNHRFEMFVLNCFAVTGAERLKVQRFVLVEGRQLCHRLGKKARVIWITRHSCLANSYFC